MEVEIDFREADRRFTGLKQQFDNGDLSAEEFYAQLEQITVQDAEGRLWAKHRDTGRWHYFDGSTWVEGTPPGYREVSPEPSTSGAPENGEKRRGVLPWLLAAALVGVVLIAIVVYLRVEDLDGTATTELPKVVGKPRSEAQRILESAGFRVHAETQEGSKEYAGKVMKQSPSGAEAEKGSTVTITVGEAAPPGPKGNPSGNTPELPPGYKVVEDPTGSLTVEVPSSWGVEIGAASEGAGGSNSWSYYAGEDITSSITTARSLDAWYQGQGAEGGSGAYIVASRALAQQYTDDELIYSLLYDGKANVCTTGPYEDFDRPSYSGKKQTWYDCAGHDNASYVVAAAPEGRECVVVLGAKLAPGADAADREAVEHILDSFEVDCGGIAGARTGNWSVAEVAPRSGSIQPGYGGI